MRVWRCEYTGELVVGSKEFGGFPLFGGKLPFIGWKWIGCRQDGFVDNETWPPKFVTMKLGVMWLGHGLFYSPPWRMSVRAIR